MQLFRPLIRKMRQWQRQRQLTKMPGGPDWKPNLTTLELRELRYGVNHSDLKPFYRLIDGHIEQLHQAKEPHEKQANALWDTYVPNHKSLMTKFDTLYLGKAYVPVFKEFRANHPNEFSAFMTHHRQVLKFWHEIYAWRRNRAALDREAARLVEWWRSD